MNQRLGVYRKIAAVRTERELEDALAEVRDRYGPPPPSVQNLAAYGRIRVLADRLRVDTIDREGHAIVFKFRPDATVDPARLVNLLKRRPDIQLTPPTVLKLDLKHAAVAPKLVVRPNRADTLKQVGQATQNRQGKQPLGRSAEPSWWTKRATAGEVKAGFTKENLTRTAKEDPLVQGGLFDRTLGLLQELTDDV
jgi:transcription-repair coupling factor (superfamily II helicase)